MRYIETPEQAARRRARGVYWLAESVAQWDAELDAKIEAKRASLPPAERAVWEADRRRKLAAMEVEHERDRIRWAAQTRDVIARMSPAWEAAEALTEFEAWEAAAPEDKLDAIRRVRAAIELNPRRRLAAAMVNDFDVE